MAELSLQHQAREHLNVIALLARCLQMRNATAAELRQWRGDVVVAAGRLKLLYARGLDRRQLLARIRAEARPSGATNVRNRVTGTNRATGTNRVTLGERPEAPGPASRG